MDITRKEGADGRIGQVESPQLLDRVVGAGKRASQRGPLRRLDAVWPTILSLLFMVAPPISADTWLIQKEPLVGFYHILEREAIPLWRMLEVSRF
jgi:hypothetical protein